MGVIAFGVGIGGLALYGAMLHLIHHSLLKSSLFLSAGNLVLGFGTKLVAQIRQHGRGCCPGPLSPFSAVLSASPACRPSASSSANCSSSSAPFKTGHPVAAGLFIAGLILVVAGFARIVTAMSFGPSQEEILVQEQVLRLVAALCPAAAPRPSWRLDAGTALYRDHRRHHRRTRRDHPWIISSQINNGEVVARQPTFPGSSFPRFFRLHDRLGPLATATSSSSSSIPEAGPRPAARRGPHQ